mmetsp:Transcript_23586/g.44543  ORF Transcript_23586/g.44543 Transcript_23586/m.44543 type:complete len:96 (-) Transcript_23586:654-941(-)
MGRIFFSSGETESWRGSLEAYPRSLSETVRAWRGWYAFVRGTLASEPSAETSERALDDFESFRTSLPSWAAVRCKVPPSDENDDILDKDRPSLEA